MSATLSHTPATGHERNAPALELVGVSKSYGDVEAVRSVSLDVQPGEIVALVGPSGCGKSSLLRMVAGISPVDSGRVVLGGNVVDDGVCLTPPEKRGVGLVFQEHALFPHLTVDDNIGFGLRGQPDQAARIAEMLTLVGLTDHGNRYPHELSGGERQRVALARALAPSPSLLLLDEPFASLDPNLRAQIRVDVTAALRATNTPAVFVTHSQDEALASGDRIAVMDAGQIQQVGTPETVFHEPTTQFVAAFMGEADFTTGADAVAAFAIEDHAMIAGLGDLGNTVMVRPDDILLIADSDEADSDITRGATAKVIGAEFRGAEWCYTVELGSGLRVRALRDHLSPLPIGADVNVAMNPGHRPVPVGQNALPHVLSSGA